MTSNTGSLLRLARGATTCPVKHTISACLLGSSKQRTMLVPVSSYLHCPLHAGTKETSVDSDHSPSNCSSRYLQQTRWQSPEAAQRPYDGSQGSTEAARKANRRAARKAKQRAAQGIDMAGALWPTWLREDCPWLVTDLGDLTGNMSRIS